MQITVFPVSVMQVIFRHRRLRTIENRGLVHIIPDVHVRSCALERRELEKACPPFMGFGRKAVYPVGRSRPTPAFVNVGVFVAYSKSFGFQIVYDGVVISILDVRIDEYNELAAVRVKL